MNLAERVVGFFLSPVGSGECTTNAQQTNITLHHGDCRTAFQNHLATRSPTKLHLNERITQEKKGTSTKETTWDRHNLTPSTPTDCWR
jgi:hypothetical protein